MLHAVKCRSYHPTLVSMKEGTYADGINLGYVAEKVDYLAFIKYHKWTVSCDKWL